MIAPVSQERRNNFDMLRIVAAMFVIHGHGWVLSGGVGPGLWGVPFARIGLDIFFSISGYLITRSWQRTPDFGSFLAKRLRRILSGLVACVLVTMLVFGTLATRLPLIDYLGSTATWRYLSNTVLFNTLNLPGVFEGLAEHGAVNGSLWSLLPEFVCYLSVPLIAVATRGSGIVQRCWTLIVLAALTGGLGLWLFEGYDGPTFVIYRLDIKYGLVEAPFFLVGSLLALLEPRLRGLWRGDLCLLFISLNYGVSSWVSWWNLPLEWFTLPYIVICVGRETLPGVRHVSRFGDLSYGLYLYAFPVQQLVLLWWPGVAYPVLLCVLLTLPLAWLSWHLVEKPMLRSPLRAPSPS